MDRHIKLREKDVPQYFAGFGIESQDRLLLLVGNDLANSLKSMMAR
jgi:hypothetical protein